MKKRTLIPGIIALTSALIILVTTIIQFSKPTKSVTSLVIFILAFIILVGGAVLSYLYNDRIGGLVIFVGGIIGIIAFRMASKVVNGQILTANWQLIIWLLCIIATFAGAILAIYRLPEKDNENEIFHNTKGLNIPSLIISSIMVILLIVVTITQISAKSVVTPFLCIVLLLLIAGANVLKYIFKTPIGGLLLIFVPILVIMGIVPAELGQNNASVLFMFIIDVLAFALVIAEFKVVGISKVDK